MWYPLSVSFPRYLNHVYRTSCTCVPSARALLRYLPIIIKSLLAEKAQRDTLGACVGARWSCRVRGVCVREYMRVEHGGARVCVDPLYRCRQLVADLLEARRGPRGSKRIVGVGAASSQSRSSSLLSCVSQLTLLSCGFSLLLSRTHTHGRDSITHTHTRMDQEGAQMLCHRLFSLANTHATYFLLDLSAPLSLTQYIYTQGPMHSPATMLGH